MALPQRQIRESAATKTNQECIDLTSCHLSVAQDILDCVAVAAEDELLPASTIGNAIRGVRYLLHVAHEQIGDVRGV